MPKIDSAYAYYIMTYGNKEVSRYDSHKKSELRSIYNRIVKTNKESPLYKLKEPEEAKRYAIDIKENAKAIQNVVASLSDQEDGIENAFQKKVAVSSEDSIVSAKYIGAGNESNDTEQFDIEVLNLAGPQINTGRYLDSSAFSFIPGAYSFDLDTTTGAYELQYNVNTGDSNRTVQEKLAKLINNSNLGISAEILDGPSNTSALQITSKQTGLSENEAYLFNINPGANSQSMEAMSLLGINNITSPASNSTFLLNGAEHNSFSNTFTINSAFELSLKDISAGQPIHIGFKTSVDAVADNIGSLIDAFNAIIQVSENYLTSDENNTKLYRDVSSISHSNQKSLESIGLMVNDNGSIYINKEILAEAITPESANRTFAILNHFKDSIGNKANDACINPMNYVNKVIVAYKNPNKNFATPYITSLYAGMMLDDYV